MNLQVYTDFLRMLRSLTVLLSHLKFSPLKSVLLKSIIDAVSEVLHLKIFQMCKHPAKNLTCKSELL